MEPQQAQAQAPKHRGHKHLSTEDTRNSTGAMKVEIHVRTGNLRSLRSAQTTCCETEKATIVIVRVSCQRERKASKKNQPCCVGCQRAVQCSSLASAHLLSPRTPCSPNLTLLCCWPLSSPLLSSSLLSSLLTAVSCVGELVPYFRVRTCRLALCRRLGSLPFPFFLFLCRRCF